MPERIIINEVAPRDGLQNQSRVLSPQQRLTLINALLEAGLTHIEIGSFVSPKAVPAMAGTSEVAAGLPKGEQYQFSALIPNRRGYDLALASDIRNVSMVVAASEGMNQNNINMGTRQAVDVAKEIFEQGRLDGANTLAYIATAWECPYDGLVAAAKVIDIATELFDAGCSEIILADTIGAASPGQVKSLLLQLDSVFGLQRFSCHFHDTRGMGVANVYASIECGVRKFDAAMGSLGGCPFAPGATGNVATEDVLLMLRQMGFDCDVNIAKFVHATEVAAKELGLEVSSKSLNWLRRNLHRFN